ncbi:MAG: hypothetical protein QOJ21_2095 [Solirubrobacteraceae bacterium]|jgi:hypothetical protein|nr:hypothetical protein [Solirubrobacteraceae bacterium]
MFAPPSADAEAMGPRAGHVATEGQRRRTTTTGHASRADEPRPARCKEMPT